VGVAGGAVGVTLAVVPPQPVLAGCWAAAGKINAAGVAWMTWGVASPPLVLTPESVGVGVTDGDVLTDGVGVGVADGVSVGVAVGVGAALAAVMGALGLADAFGEQATAGTRVCWVPCVLDAPAGTATTPSGSQGRRLAVSAAAVAGPAASARCALTEFVGVNRVRCERLTASTATATTATTAATASTGRSQAAAGPRRRRALPRRPGGRRPGYSPDAWSRVRKGPGRRPGPVNRCRTWPSAARPVLVAGSSRTENRIPLSRSHSVNEAVSEVMDRGELSW